MKYLKKYNSDFIDQIFVDDINDMLLDLTDYYIIQLKVWIRGWFNVNKLEPGLSLSILMLPKRRNKFLTKQEVNDMVEFMKRVNDYNNKRYNLYIHYDLFDRETKNKYSNVQQKIDIKDIDVLNTYSFKDDDIGNKKDYISSISITINNT